MESQVSYYQELIFVDDKTPYYVLTKSGEVFEVPAHDVLEVSDSKSLLECRKNQWEANYCTSPHSTRRPPWLPKLPEEADQLPERLKWCLTFKPQPSAS